MQSISFLLIIVAMTVPILADDANFDTKVRPFLEKHCLDCHDDLETKGNFRADLLAPDPTAKQHADKWGQVLDRLEAGEMPPAKRRQPKDAEVKAVVHWIKHTLAESTVKRRSDGRVRIRRLNRLEYENTVHDLLGIAVPLQDMLPEDDLADGFSNATEALSISPVHIRQYMAAADAALAAAIVRQRQPETQKHVFKWNDESEKPFWGHPNNKVLIRPRDDGSLWFYSDTHIEVPANLRQFHAKLTKHNPGVYRIRITARSEDSDGKPIGWSLWTAAGGKRRDLIGYYDALPGKPTTIEVTHWFSNDTIIVAPYRIQKHRTDAGLSVYSPRKELPKDWNTNGETYEPEGPALIISPIEIEGPINRVWPPLGHQRLFGKVPSVPVKEVPREFFVPRELRVVYRNYMIVPNPVTPHSKNPVEDAKKLIQDLLPIAFRRPTTDEEVDLYHGIVRASLEQGNCFEVAMRAAWRAVLCSPDFLFIVEEPGPLSDHALACRLSYFLWRSMPDEALLDVASRGELHKPKVLRNEVERLLKSPKSTAFVRDFVNHWLNLRELDATTPDRDLFPEYFSAISSGTIDGLLHKSVSDETYRFFEDLIERNATLKHLIQSDYTFLNGRLAEHYGIPDVEGVKMRRVKLPAESQRGGVLTHASVLKVTANGATTSPVLRGVWLLERILGRPTPIPPPNAGAIEPDTRGATTVREQLKLHQRDPSCAGCHRRIDPPGFALEAFDPIGQFRTFYRASETGEKLDVKFFAGTGYRKAKYLKGAQVDATGTTSNDQQFTSPAEFKRLMLDDADKITRNLASKLVTFATGFHTEPGDILELDRITTKTAEDDYGLRTLIHQVIQSPLFLRK